MVQFFQNIWKAISDNWAATGVTISIGSLVTMIITLVKLFVAGKTVKNNTAAVGTLTSSADALVQTRVDVSDNTAAVNELSKRVDDMTNSLTELKDFYTGMDKKLAAIVDAMLIAYSTVKNEEMRSTINAILTNCKFEEVNKVVELEEQLAKLKAELKSMTDAMTKTVEEVVDQATETVNSVSRY